MDLRGFAEGVYGCMVFIIVICLVAGMAAASFFHLHSINTAKRYREMNPARAWAIYIEQREIADRQLDNARQDHARAYGLEAKPKE